MKQKLMYLVLGFLFISNYSFGSEQTVESIGTYYLDGKADIAFISLYVNASETLLTKAEQTTNEKIDTIKNVIATYSEDIIKFEVFTKKYGDGGDRYSMRSELGSQPEVVKQIRITVLPDLKLITRIIDRAILNGAALKWSSSSGYGDELAGAVVFGIRNSSEIEAKALSLAFENAKEKAEILAKGLGLSKMKLLTITQAANCTTHFSAFVSGRAEKFNCRYLGSDPDKIPVIETLKTIYSCEK